MPQTADALPAPIVRSCARLCFLIFIAVGAFSQNSTFPTADIHRSPSLAQPRMQGGVVRSGRYELRQATMLDYQHHIWHEIGNMVDKLTKKYEK